MMQSEINKKRKTRTKSSEIINQRKYECHCGRKYLSYSALYIHSKQKHGITITTKAYDNRYEAQLPIKNKYSNQDSQITNQKYSQNHTFSNKEVENIQRTIFYFVNQQAKGSTKQIQFMYWTFEQLIVCVNNNTNLLESFVQPGNYTEKRSPDFLPLIFNFFLVDYCPKTLGVLYESSREKMKEVILKFGQWLYEHGLSYFQIRPNLEQEKK